MTVGFSTLTQSGEYIQIDEKFRCPTAGNVFLHGGNITGDWIDFPPQIDMRVACPTVFVRSAGWVGNFTIIANNSGSPRPKGCIFFYSTAPVEFMFVSTQNQNIASNRGLEIYHPEYGTVFSSAQRYPRIVEMPMINVTGPNHTVPISKGNSKNWFCINPITPGLSRPLGQGSDYSYPPYVHMALLQQNSFSLKFIENGLATNILAQEASLSPYFNRQFRTPIAIIPGT